ncbi:MAG TPA: copper amine oxidase N-terminal domain-containing protein [Peptococcaceae bacterium]|jgi:hypothetical protein|nr:copper amine oxidase N-terminal domain-containing protein [Clostridia bacterium]HOB82670.1 copper amine oxidase N-terminal domain-containing protein [Peptococcaceae bacterium]HPZ71862.1 copper amine oxidase N-terminal domain-containing protein [Peptococcaceae bacterium]HQD53761.1 copper amine oxidase N-terminal domain-containing protein [Peptococcaceae bacterium]
MKKITILLLLAFILTMLGTVVAWGASTRDKIADYTVQYRYLNGISSALTYDIYEEPGRSNDEVIESTLKKVRASNNKDIFRITHVNDKEISRTKWAKYGGVINSRFKNDPAGVKAASKPPTTSTKEVRVFINGKQVTFPDQKPIIIQGRTMVPMRAVFEHPDVQAQVVWNEKNRTVTATDRSDKTIVFKIGDNYYTVKTGSKEEKKYSDVAPRIQSGRTLLPLRALSESLDFEVNWIDNERKVDIKEKPGNKRKLLPAEEWEKILKK